MKTKPKPKKKDKLIKIKGSFEDLLKQTAKPKKKAKP
jgi:hypothetical protein